MLKLGEAKVAKMKNKETTLIANFSIATRFNGTFGKPHSIVFAFKQQSANQIAIALKKSVGKMV